MDTQFKILGHSLDEYTPLSEYTKEDNVVLNRVKNWGLSYRFHTPLYRITSLFVEKYMAKYHDTLFSHSYSVEDGENSLSWNSSERVFVCKLCGSEQVFSSPHVEKILLNTGWFELYTARMLSKIHPEEDIRINCVFKNTKRLPKNEIDIILNTGTKLIFIECKTQVYNTTDIDKFNSAVKNYGGLGSKALFVTNSKMRPEAQEKCDDHNITTFYFDNEEYTTTQDLLDAFSSVITIVGTKLSNKSPNKKHPYGYGRIEYFTSVIISAIVLFAGVTAVRESILKIINPEESNYNVISLIIIIVAVIVKFVFGKYVKNVGKKVNSGSLIASGQEAFMDSIVSFSTLVAAIINYKMNINLEGYLGIIIGIIALLGGAGFAIYWFVIRKKRSGNEAQ